MRLGWQVEVHRTDVADLRQGQWRLALGFKVLERLPLLKSPDALSPMGADVRRLQESDPGLLPPFTVGELLEDRYLEAVAREQVAPRGAPRPADAAQNVK